jgi:tetratricopeptide (TPR) repeat protein
LQIWQQSGATYAEAFLYMNLASVALKRQQWAQATDYLSQSQELCARTRTEDFLAEVYRHLSQAHLGLGQIALAEEWAIKSLELAQAQEMKLEEGASHRVLGQIRRAQSNWDDAERELQASITILDSLDSQYEMGKTLFELAQLHRDLGRDDQFHQTLDQAIAIFERMGAQLDLEWASNIKKEEIK